MNISPGPGQIAPQAVLMDKVDGACRYLKGFDIDNDISSILQTYWNVCKANEHVWLVVLAKPYLDVIVWVPVHVVDDDCVCRSQIDSQTSSLGGQQEYTALGGRVCNSQSATRLSTSKEGSVHKIKILSTSKEGSVHKIKILSTSKEGSVHKIKILSTSKEGSVHEIKILSTSKGQFIK